MICAGQLTVRRHTIILWKKGSAKEAGTKRCHESERRKMRERGYKEVERGVEKNTRIRMRKVKKKMQKS